MTAASVFHFTDSGAYGGAEHALALLLGHLDRDRWRSTLLHHDLPGIAPLLRMAAELEVPALPVRRMPLGLEGARRVPHFARLLTESRPTIFHAHQTDPLACKYAIVAAIAARVPVIIATTHLFLEIGAVARLQQRILARGVDRWLAVSAATGLRLTRMLGRGARVVVVPNGVDPIAFDVPCEPTLRARLAGPRDEPVVLAVGRLTEQKGFRYLIDCVDRLPGVRFVIAGDGPERARLERQAAEEVGDRVQFLGARTDVPALLACCDAFVLPSLYEGLPLAILEAMAAGKPVIATAVDGNAEAVVHEQTGLLVPPGDVDSLANAVQRVTGDPELGRVLGGYGRARVRSRFTAASVAGRVGAIYEQVLRGGRG